MRKLVIGTIVAAVVVMAAVGGHAQQPGADDAAVLMRAARRAIGPDSALSNLRSVVFRAQLRLLNGASGKLGDPLAMETRILFPEHYLRIYVSHGVRHKNGFSGSRLLNAAKAVSDAVQFAPTTYGPEEIVRQRTGFARLMLGMLARVDKGLECKVGTATGQDTIEVSGPDGFEALVDLDHATRIPLRVRHQDDVHFPEPGSRFPSAPQRAEVIVSFDDRRAVGGLELPHRITQTSRGIVLQEMVLSEIRVNPPLTPKDFVE
jgi:hypothetical protein